MGQKALGGGYKHVEEIKVVTGTKITRDFLNQDGNKDRFNPKSRSWNNKNKTQHVQNKNPIGFYCKHKTRTKQNYDKETYSKFVLKILKVVGYFISIYTH